MATDPRVLRALLQDSFSPDELVELCFDLNVEYHNLTGESHATRVIALVSHMQRNDRLEELEEAIVASRPALRTSLGREASAIPLIIAAMTRGEAAELRRSLPAQLDAAITAGSSGPNVAHLQRGISSAELQEMLDQYGPTRESWRPFGQESIDQMVREMAQRFGYELIPLSDVVLSPKPELTAKRLRTVYDLQRTSCLLIIDGLSLYHPGLRQLLSDSGLVTGAKPITTLFLAPVAPGYSQLLQQLRDSFSRTFAPVFFRFDEYDQLCDFAAFSRLNLQRWLDRTLPHTARIIGGEDPNLERIQGMRQSVAKEETDIRQVLFGEQAP